MSKLGILFWKNVRLKRRAWLGSLSELILPILPLLVVAWTVGFWHAADLPDFPTHIVAWNFSLSGAISSTQSAYGAEDRICFVGSDKTFSQFYPLISTSNFHPVRVSSERALVDLMSRPYNRPLPYRCAIGLAETHFRYPGDVDHRYTLYTTRTSEFGSVTPSHISFEDRESRILPWYYASRGSFALVDALRTILLANYGAFAFNANGMFPSQVEASKSFEVSFGTMPMPRVRYKYQFDNADHVLATVVVSLFIIPFLQTTSWIIIEKETKMAELLRTMGASAMEIIFSWFLVQSASMILTALLAAGIAALLLYPIAHPPLFLLLYIVAGLHYISGAVLFSAFFSRSRTAQLIGSILFFTSAIFGFFIPIYSSDTVIMGLSLLPGAGFVTFLRMMFDFARFDQVMESSQLSIPTPVVSPATVLICMVAGTLLCCLFAVYFHLVLPSEFGTPLPWYFPLRLSSWRRLLRGCCCRHSRLSRSDDAQGHGDLRGDEGNDSYMKLTDDAANAAAAQAASAAPPAGASVRSGINDSASRLLPVSPLLSSRSPSGSSSNSSSNNGLFFGPPPTHPRARVQQPPDMLRGREILQIRGLRKEFGGPGGIRAFARCSRSNAKSSTSLKKKSSDSGQSIGNNNSDCDGDDDDGDDDGDDDDNVDVEDDDDNFSDDSEGTNAGGGAGAAPRVRRRKRAMLTGNTAAVRSLNLDVYQGELFALLGHNGAGKTTTLSVITGLYPPTSGAVRVCGRSLTSRAHAGTGEIGVCPQQDILYSQLTVRDHLHLFAQLKGVPSGAAADAAVAYWADRLGLGIRGDNKIDALVDTLSGGQKRKVSLAMAFIGNPKLVVLDEPTAGLDFTAQRAVRDILLAERQERAVLLTTHIMEDAEVCDRVGIMAQGSLQCLGSPLFLKKEFGAGYSLAVTKSPLAPGEADKDEDEDEDEDDIGEYSDATDAAGIIAGGVGTDNKDCSLRSRLQTPSGRALDAYLRPLLPSLRVTSDAAGETRYLVPFDAADALPTVLEAVDAAPSQLRVLSASVAVASFSEVFLKVAGDAVVNDDDRDVPATVAAAAAWVGADGAEVAEAGNEKKSEAPGNGPSESTGPVQVSASPRSAAFTTAAVSAAATAVAATSEAAPVAASAPSTATTSKAAPAFATIHTPLFTPPDNVSTVGPHGSAPFTDAPFSGDGSSGVGGIGGGYMGSDATIRDPFAHGPEQDWSGSYEQRRLYGRSLFCDMLGAMLMKRARAMSNESLQLRWGLITPVVMLFITVCAAWLVLSTFITGAPFEMGIFHGPHLWGSPVTPWETPETREFISSLARLLPHIADGTHLQRLDAREHVKPAFDPCKNMDELGPFLLSHIFTTSRKMFRPVDIMPCRVQNFPVAPKAVKGRVSGRVKRTVSRYSPTGRAIEEAAERVATAAAARAARAAARAAATAERAGGAVAFEQKGDVSSVSWLSSNGTFSGVLPELIGGDEYNEKDEDDDEDNEEDPDNDLFIPTRISMSLILNTTIPYSFGIAHVTLTNTILRMAHDAAGASGPAPTLRVHHEAVPVFSSNSPSVDEMIYLLIGFLGIVLGSINYVSTLAHTIVAERVSGAMHLQLISGATRRTYWLGHALWDLLLSTIPLLGYAVVLTLFGVLQQMDFLMTMLCVAVYFLFIFASIPACYSLSFVVNEPARAQILIFLVNIVSLVFALVLSAGSADSFDDFILVLPMPFVPPYALVFTLFFATSLAEGSLNRSTLTPLISLAANAAIAWALLYLTQSNRTRSCRKKLSLSSPPASLTTPTPMELAEPMDDDVARERTEIIYGERENSLHYPIVLNGLRKVYKGEKNDPPHIALSELYFSVARGQCFGFLGTNGAGKTTTLRLLTGATQATSGTATVCGFDIVSDHAAVSASVGYCPQEDAFLPLLTPRDNLRLFARLRGVSMADIDAFVVDIMSRVGLGADADRLSETLSGGNKRKLSVAIALIGNPPVVILDEPTTGVDPQARRQIWQLISSTMANRSVILTTHSMEECEALSSRIGIMIGGRLRCLGSPEHLKNRFGRGYHCSVIADEAQAGWVVGYVLRSLPGAECTSRHGGALEFSVPSAGGITLAHVFRVLAAEDKGGILSYTARSTDLGEIFSDLLHRYKSHE